MVQGHHYNFLKACESIKIIYMFFEKYENNIWVNNLIK